MNPNDIFWLASYAHRQLTQIVEAPYRFTLTLQFGGDYPGVDIWMYGKDSESSFGLPYGLGYKTKEQVDEFAAKVKALESITA